MSTINNDFRLPLGEFLRAKKMGISPSLTASKRKTPVRHLVRSVEDLRLLSVTRERHEKGEVASTNE